MTFICGAESGSIGIHQHGDENDGKNECSRAAHIVGMVLAPDGRDIDGQKCVQNEAEAQRCNTDQSQIVVKSPVAQDILDNGDGRGVRRWPGHEKHEYRTGCDPLYQ